MPDTLNSRLGWVVIVTIEPNAASGSYGWAGTANATRASRGSASGAYTWAGAAAAAPNLIGSANGSYTFAGSAVGETMLDFVTLNPNGYLVADGTRFRFSGNNWPGLALNEDSVASYGGTVVTAPVAGRGNYPLHLSTHSEIDDYLDQCVDMNATVVRSFAAMTIGHPLSVQPTFGVFEEDNLEPLDYALQECADLGIRMILPLSDNYEYYMGGKFDYCRWNGVTPDGTASQFFTNTTIINSLKDHIDFVLDHVNVYTGVAYKDDPAILAWETGNEVGYTYSPTNAAWTENIAAHIKAQGAQQLVMDGACYPSSSEMAAMGLENMPSVDIHTQHPYNIASNTPALTAGAATYAKTYGKAFVWGEWPPNGKGFPLSLGSHQNLQWTYADFFDAIEDGATDGDLIWALFPHGQFHETVFAIHSPGDDAGMITRVAQFTAHAAAMSAPPPAKTGSATGAYTRAGSAIGASGLPGATLYPSTTQYPSSTLYPAA